MKKNNKDEIKEQKANKVKFTNKLFDVFDKDLTLHKAIEKLFYLLLSSKVSYRLDAYIKKITVSPEYLLYQEKKVPIIKAALNSAKERFKEELKDKKLSEHEKDMIINQKMQRMFISPETNKEWGKLHTMPVELELDKFQLNLNTIGNTDDPVRKLMDSDWDILKQFIDFIDED